MKREIKFRGKYSQGHEWVYGHYYNNCDCGVNQDIIICFDEETGTGKEYLINTSFLGQFTGQFDCDGKEIYEGDVVEILTISDRKRLIEFNRGAFRITSGEVSWYMFDFKKKEIEVIGNIYDNPDLLPNACETQKC